MASLMPSGAPETFTGADGSAPNATNVVQTLNEGTGGGLSILGNQLRLRTGTVAQNRTSFRITGLSVADVETVFTWTVNSGLYGQVMVRAGSNVDTGNGYLLSLVPTDMTIGRHVSYSGPNLATVTHGFTNGQRVRTRVAMFGQVLRVRTWLATDPEPTSVWDLTVTDLVGSGGISGAGFVGWTASSATTGSKDLMIDDIDVQSTITPTQATLFATGSISMSGAETSTTNKKLLGSITPSGALTKSRAVVKILIGSIASSGLVKKTTLKAFAGSVAPATILTKRANKIMVGSIAPVALLRRAYVKRFAGSITPAGVTGTLAVGRIFGRPGIVVMSLVRRAEVSIRHRKG